MRDFIERIMQAQQRAQENDRGRLEAERQRNMDLVDNAMPGGVPAYTQMREEQMAEDPEMEQKLFGNPYTNLIKKLLGR